MTLATTSPFIRQSLSQLGSQFLLQVRDQLVHDGINLLVIQRLRLILQHEVHGIALLAGLQILAFVHIEQCHLFQQLLLRSVGHLLNLGKLHRLVQQEGQVAAHGRILADFRIVHLVVADGLHQKSPIQVGKIHLAVNIQGLEELAAHDAQHGQHLPAAVLYLQTLRIDVAMARREHQVSEVHAQTGQNVQDVGLQLIKGAFFVGMRPRTAHALAGHPKYEVESGQVLLDGEDLMQMTADERAKAGLFLAMQYPVEVPGVSMTNFLRTAKTEIDGEAPALRTWSRELGEAMKRLKMDPKFATRSVNEGFSGGEKKRAEVLQLELLKPKFAVLDETDSGLDVDALRIVSEGVNRAKENTGLGILMVTHYTRILKYIKPDIVHVFADGHFVRTGGPELADELEENGYDQYLPEGADSESALA